MNSIASISTKRKRKALHHGHGGFPPRTPNNYDGDNNKSHAYWGVYAVGSCAGAGVILLLESNQIQNDAYE